MTQRNNRMPGWVFTGVAVVTLVWLLAPLSGPVRAQEKKAQKEETESGAKSDSGARKNVNRRDPFLSPRRQGDDSAPRSLPPGKRGLVIARLVLEGIVLGPMGRIAVVTMPGRISAFFLREGDELYDGTVLEIRDDSVLFKEKSTDAFGKIFEREVVRMLTGSTP